MALLVLLVLALVSGGLDVEVVIIGSGRGGISAVVTAVAADLLPFFCCR